MKRINISNKLALYIIAALCVVVAIMIFGGAEWLRGVRMDGSLGLNHLNWPHILLSIGLGFGLGWLVFKRN